MRERGNTPSVPPRQQKRTIDLTLDDDDVVVLVKQEVDVIPTGPKTEEVEVDEEDLEDHLEEIRIRRKLRARKKRKMAGAKGEL